MGKNHTNEENEKRKKKEKKGKKKTHTHTHPHPHTHTRYVQTGKTDKGRTVMRPGDPEGQPDTPSSCI